MVVALKEQNGVAGLIALLETNGTTIVRIKGNGSSHALMVDDGTTGSDHGPTVAKKDDNGVATLCVTSSTDGKTLLPVYGTSDGKLKIKST